MQPIVHPVTEKTLSVLVRNLPQSLLLHGEVGVGLHTVSLWLASQVGGQVITVLPEKDEMVNIDKGVISIDSIRKLYIQSRSIQTKHLIIVIDYAERMADKAQNAFLKLLEEPGKNIHFVLASHNPDSLLPTIQSRVQSVEIRPITGPQTEKFLDEIGVLQDKKRTQLLYMANGLPAEISRLVADDNYFDTQASIVRDARTLLSASTYEKLRIAHIYKDDRERALKLISTAMRILHRSISDKPQDTLLLQINGLLYAYKQINANGNIRLCIARLVL